ncbi:JAB domain-containing protein [Dolosigranulum pigrum]|uniref:JAB domain-containing protein n=1 Tax=Dolosigranulum pigrum TaxID=29394 RepID=UPI001AD89AF3|nr:JAB domain-containing protein [Dolosigranulum pigrum]
MKKKIEGLNMVNDEEELMKQLKLGNQDHQSEHFSLITYDQNYDVNDYHIESIGGTRSTVVDVKRFAPLITDDNVHGIALCHNHPSGDPEPSDADKETTQNMIDFTNVFDKQVYDHYVVGRSSVRKLSGERTLWNLSKQKEEIVNEFSKPRQLEMFNESESSLVDLSNEEREAIEKRAIYDEITGRPINNLEPVYQLGCGDEVMSPAIHEKIFSDEEWCKLYEKDGDSFFYTEIQYDMEVPVQELEDNPTFKNNYKLNGKDIGTLSDLGKILTDGGEVDGVDRLDELVKDIYLNNRQDIGYTLYNNFEPVDLKEKYGIEIVHGDSDHDITQDEFER